MAAGVLPYLSSVMRLTRWREHLPFVAPATVVGAVMAAQTEGSQLNYRLLLIAAANTLAVSFAFMINDVEDAEDDAGDPVRAARNPVATGDLTTRQGWSASAVVVAAALSLYSALGGWPLAAGCLTLVLSLFYSWRAIRLKALPIVDVVSHSLMLGGLLYASGCLTYGTLRGLLWPFALAATLMSAYGQIYNQLRDFEADRAAGLSNTTIVVGRRAAVMLMYGSLFGAGVMFLVGVWSGLVPIWVVGTALASFAVSCWLSPIPEVDSRGAPLAEASGGFQGRLLVAANAAASVWLIGALLKS